MGVVLLEFLVALFIGAIALSGVVAVVDCARATARLSEQTEHHQLILATLTALSAQIIRSSDSHPLPLQPYIHPDAPRFRNGDSLALSRGRYAPKLGQQAISWLELDFAATLRVRDRGALITACGIFRESLSLAGVELVLGIGVDGNVLLRLDEQVLHPPNCRSLRVTVVSSTVIESTAVAAESLTHIVPVLRENLLYVDRTDTLRWVALVGEAIRENAPLLDNAPRITWELDAAAGQGTYQLVTASKFSEAPPHELRLLDQIGTISWPEFLLRY